MTHIQNRENSLKTASEAAHAEDSGVGGASPQHIKGAVEAVGMLELLSTQQLNTY